MKAIFKGILVVVVTVFFFGLMVGKARAGTQEEFLNFLKGKEVIHNGFCSMDKAGNLVRQSKVEQVELCVSMYDPAVPNMHYVAIVDEKGVAMRLIRLDINTFEQEVVWRKGKQT